MFCCSWIMQHATPISNFPTCDLLGSLQTPLGVSQPMDQGIIRNVKVHYHKLLMQSLLATMDCTSFGSELARTVSVLDAVIWISQAVKKLLSKTVTRCFEEAGFFTGEVSLTTGKNKEKARTLIFSSVQCNVCMCSMIIL